MSCGQHTNNNRNQTTTETKQETTPTDQSINQQITRLFTRDDKIKALKEKQGNRMADNTPTFLSYPPKGKKSRATDRWQQPLQQPTKTKNRAEKRGCHVKRMPCRSFFNRWPAADTPTTTETKQEMTPMDQSINGSVTCLFALDEGTKAFKGTSKETGWQTTCQPKNKGEVTLWIRFVQWFSCWKLRKKNVKQWGCQWFGWFDRLALGCQTKYKIWFNKYHCLFSRL